MRRLVLPINRKLASTTYVSWGGTSSSPSECGIGLSCSILSQGVPIDSIRSKVFTNLVRTNILSTNLRHQLDKITGITIRVYTWSQGTPKWESYRVKSDAGK